MCIHVYHIKGMYLSELKFYGLLSILKKVINATTLIITFIGTFSLSWLILQLLHIKKKSFINKCMINALKLPDFSSKKYFKHYVEIWSKISVTTSFP